ncbi:MAG: hypothetical protein EA376_01250 [Phycisphaeraceae bacterium]|nr:MAG: hypothetical protein EA376_01250 [Phycisphaeraceae bacterium]
MPKNAKARPPARPDAPDIPTSLNLTAEAAIEVEAAAGEDGGAQRLPRFSAVAYTGGAMRLAGWRFPVVVDLAGMAIPSPKRPIRFTHDPSAGVGHTDAIRVEGGRLVASGVISRDTPVAREVVASSKNGFPWQASIGASVDEFEFVPEGRSAIVNGRSFEGPLNVVRRSTLGEISFVDLGADGQTSVSVAAGNSPESGVRSLEEDTMDLNDNDRLEETTSNDNASAATPESAGGADRASSANLPAADSRLQAADCVRDIRAEAAAESERINTVRRLCAGRPEIEAQAIREGWDATRCELEVLRAGRPKVAGAPAIHAPDNTMSAGVLEAACMMTAGLSELDSLYEPRALDLAAKRFRGGIGLQELLLEAAWANGYTGRSFRDSRAVLRYAFKPEAPDVAAGFSTIDIGGILSNVANKFLLEGFFSVERTWRNITAVRNVSDFKTVTSYRLIGKDQYEIVAPGGELKHGTLGEEQYTNKADTYGLLLAIDRRDIINDDLGAITTVPRKLGRGSGLKINDVFWTTFLNNASFFTAGNNNFIDGADTALSIDGLTRAEVAFMDQVDSDGKPIGIMPAMMLVPTSLSAIGTQLFRSLELRDTTANTKFPVANPHQGKFRVEVSRYLANAQFPGFSNKAWYLLAEPADLPVIETAFLNGQESPTIETAEADFNVLGVQMRGYHDFGVNLQDSRGGVKAKGEA